MDKKVQEENSNSQNVNYTILSCQRGTSRGSYKISLEDGSSFFLSVDFFLEHHIKKDLVIDKDLYNKIVKESDFVEAYIKADSLLLRKSYTEFNLKKKLNDKDFSKEAIEAAVDRLKEQGVVNDVMYAENWVNSRLRNKLDSYTTLYAGLLNKGINSSIIKDTLYRLYTDEIESGIIFKAIEKFKRQGKDSNTIIKKLIQKGFNSKVVNRRVNESDRS